MAPTHSFIHSFIPQIPPNTHVRRHSQRLPLQPRLPHKLPKTQPLPVLCTRVLLALPTPGETWLMSILQTEKQKLHVIASLLPESPLHPRPEVSQQTEAKNSPENRKAAHMPCFWSVAQPYPSGRCQS